MKSNKNSKKFTSRVLSFAICIALVICAVFSFGFIGLPNRALADGEDDAAPAAKSENGIRFVQVAAGETFAIGLTYDGKLYGWSLTPDYEGKIGKESGLSVDDDDLGTYYPSDPTLIDVTFLRGPGGDGTYEWGDTDTYHSDKEQDGSDVKVKDRIIGIAATRTTAAFITANNYIYTWGNDCRLDNTNHEGIEMQERTNAEHYLLLRPVNTSSENTSGSVWYKPYIIDYDYYSTTATDYAMQFITPTPNNTTGSLSDISIAAGEYNYIIGFVKGGKYCTYVWGSLMYSVPNIVNEWGSSYVYLPTAGSGNGGPLQGGSNARKIYETDYASAASVSVVAGGYTVGLNGSTTTAATTSLQLRGKNFLTSQYDATNGYVYTTGAVTVSTGTVDGGRATSKISYSQDGDYSADNGIIGGNGSSSTSGSNNYNTGVDKEQFYGRQAATAQINYNRNSTVSVYNAANTSLNADNCALAYRYGVSLGNDVGYGISASANDGIYAWGDNKNGQLNASQIDTGSTTNELHYEKPVKILSGTYTSVVAGKQLSGEKKPLYQGGYDSLTLSGASVTGFAADVQNDDKFISGAINSDGELLVWSSYDKDTNGISKVIEKPSENNKIVAIYAGYGNHLFAINKLGKLIHIEYSSADNKYVQKTYDDFNDATGTRINNWEVTANGDKGIANSVTFTIPKSADGETADAKEPDLGNATFYVWSAATSSDSVVLNGDGNKYNPLVNTNAVGDVYRILGFGADDNKITNASFLSVDSYEDLPKAEPVGGGDGAPTFAPTFVYNGNEMTPKQQENMFDVGFVNDANGVGIKITPNQSSNGKSVKMTFWIARYNITTDFTTAATGYDNAVYYDYQQCSIEFTIADTPSVVTYSTYSDDGNSKIPLLDPNNQYNNAYSIALMDVSTGVDELIKYLTGEKTTVNASFLKAVTDQMEGSYTTSNGATVKNDAGFPAIKKINDGNLTYYLTGASSYYNNRYQFLFFDRDADRVQINTAINGSIDLSPAGSNVTYSNLDIVCVPVNLTVPLDISSWGIKTDNADNILTDFNNHYGLYNISFADDYSTVSFSYDVIRITAKGSTGGVVYENNDVSKPLTTVDNPHVNTSIHNARTITSGWNEMTASSSTAAISDILNILSASSQASLRLNDESVIGKNDGNNKLTVPDIPTLYVGSSTSFELKDYVNNLGSNIYFTFNNSAQDEYLRQFESQFTDDTGSGEKIVTLTNRTLTVKPTTNAKLNITVTVQRFASTAWDKFAGDNEKIDLTFEFNDITPFTFAANTQITNEFTIKKTEQIDLFGGVINGVSYNPYATITGLSGDHYNAVKNKVTISRDNISYTDNGSGAFTVTAPTSANPTAITITPQKAGTGVIMFIATVYGQSVKVSLEINVSFVTVLEDNNISLVDDEYVYVNTLMNQLKKENSFNADIDSYKILYNDKYSEKDIAGKDMYKAIYFTHDPYGTYDARDAYPSFIKSVTFEALGTKQPYIRIEPSTSAVDSSDVYYMHVRYANTDKDNYEEALTTDSGSVLEAVFKIESGKVVVLLDNDLEVNIDCKSSRKEGAGVWYTQGSGVNTVAYISAKELLDCLKREDASGYKIFHVSADTNAAKYFNYGFNGDNNVVITPQYNTDQPYAINVSVYNASRGESLVLTFDITVDGILTVLPVTTNDDGVIGYGNIWLYSFIIVFGVLLIIFVIRMIVYWRKRAKQRALIKRNQELIRMRDRMHSKANIASKDQVVRTKMKMEDPKYAKMFNDMRKAKEEESGISLDNSDLAATAKSKSKKKKKGGKKSVAELKAELEAKKAAFAAAQAQSAQPVNPFGEVPLTDSGFATATEAFSTPMDDFGNPAGFDEPVMEPVMNEKEIVFDASDFGDGM